MWHFYKIFNKVGFGDRYLSVTKDNAVHIQEENKIKNVIEG